jgi:hypothetical protein
MANVLSLAMKISADATGVRQSLTPVERALQQLDREAANVTAVFKTFGDATAGAVQAQQRFATDLGFLQSALRTGQIDARQFAAEFQSLSDAAKEASEAFREGARVTAQYFTDGERLASELDRISKLESQGAISAETAARARAELSGENAKAAAAVKELADRTAEAEAVIRRFRAEQERQAAELGKYNDLFQAGLIDQETYNAAAIEALGINRQATEAARQRAEALAESERIAAKAFDTQLAEEAAAAARVAADAEKERAAAVSRAAEIIEAGLTKEQRANKSYEQSVAELNRLREAGLLDEQQYSDALQRSADAFAKATIEANKYAAASDSAGDAGTLKFNELSGVLSALPGPIGNISGRLSGLSSAGEGLARVFGGGLSQGLSSIGASVAGLVNPFTLAVAGVAGFGAAATAVAQGLTQLTGRVEELSFAARQAGVDFQTIQVLEEAATRAGVSVEALATGVQRFGARLSEAAQGSGETFNALQQLGFSLEEIQQGQNDPTEFASRVAEALAEIPEPARQAQLQIEVLGRGGESLVRAFGEIEGSTQAIRRFGGAISQLEADRLLELDGAFEDVQRSILGFGRELLTPFTGVAQSIAEALAPSIASFGRVLGNILDILSPFTSVLGVLVNTVGQVTSVVLNLISAALEPFAAAARGVSQALDFVSQSITQAFGPINDLILSVKDFFAETFFGVEETASQTSEKVEQVATAAVEMTAEQKKAYEDLQRAVEAGNNSLDGAIEKAGEFGQAGFDAAFEFQQALEDLKEQADANELNGEQYARGVANATAEYERQIEALRIVQEETRKAADEAERKAEADRQVADQLLEQARIQREFGGDADRAQAADQVLAVEREIARVREEVAAAGEGGDEQAVANGEERIRQLEEIRNQQQSIADGSAAAADAERQRLEDQRARVDELLAAGQEQTQVEQDIIAVQEQQAQATADLLAAREASNQAEADAAAARLAQLDQLQSRLEDQQQASEQGFGEGFARAFEDVDRAIGQTITKAEEFGNAGAEAAARLQEGIAAAQEQARDGILNKEAFDAEVARQKELFDQELKNIDDAEKARAEAVKANERAIAEAAKADEDRQKEQQRAAAQQQQEVAERQKAAFEEQRKLAEERAKADAAEFDRQQQRLAELNTLGPRQVQTADVRTQEGQQIVLDLFNQQQDPQLVQLRLLNKVMTRIATSIDRDLTRLGQPATIF